MDAPPPAGPPGLAASPEPSLGGGVNHSPSYAPAALAAGRRGAGSSAKSGA